MSVASAPVLQSLRTAFESQPAPNTQQQAAYTAFIAQGLPTTRLDAWKYTDLRRFATKRFQLAPAPSADVVPTGLLPFPAAIVFVDGQLQTPQSLPAGATCRLEPMPALANPETIDATVGAFERLNAAFSAARCAIRVADDVSLIEPIYLVHVWTERRQNAMTHPRVYFSVGRNSRAVLIEHHLGDINGGNFRNSVLRIAVAEGAALEHLCVQDDGGGNFDIANVAVDVAANGSYVSRHYAFGGALARTDLSVELRGRGAHAELHGLIFARDAQHLDVHTIVRHRVPDTVSREEFRGIADQRGRVVFNGKVVVAEDAQRTDASQSSRNLLLSPQAEIDTRPELEIYADDVKCAHGATVGQLDSAALFYLQSRGIDPDTARATLTHAFAAEIIDRISNTQVREHVLARFMRRMQSHSSVQTSIQASP